MNRRTLLKMLSLAGAGSLVAGLSLWRSAPAAYFLITAHPEADRARLLRLAGYAHAGASSVTATPIAPSAQDLALLVGGVLVDPGRSGAVPPELATFVQAMRARKTPGHVLLAIEPEAPAAGAAVVFECDGVVVEQIALDKNYRRIELPGALGQTVFQLRDGRLSVTEASCRHQLCRKMSGHTAGKIICAPNRLVATITGSPVGVDAVTG